MLPGPVPKRKGYHGQIQPFLSRSSPGLVLPLDPASTWCLCPWSIGFGPVHVDLVHLSHCHTESDGVFGVLVAGAGFSHGPATCIFPAHQPGLLLYRYCVYPDHCLSPDSYKKKHPNFWGILG